VALGIDFRMKSRSCCKVTQVVWFYLYISHKRRTRRTAFEEDWWALQHVSELRLSVIILYLMQI